MKTFVQDIPAGIAAGESGVELPAVLDVPERARGVVLFAHGSGASRNSPQDLEIAAILQAARFATLRLDLLDEREARNPHNVFDAELLAERLVAAANWAGSHAAVGSLPLGYLGTGTGAAAALIAAAREPELVSAIVSRSAHPDQLTSWLHRVHAPTLFIVGALEDGIAEGSGDAYRRIHADKELVVVPGARHLFDEPGALKQAAEHASRWFGRHLVSIGRRWSCAPASPRRSGSPV
jgi:putative phosphoribosyl transferase